VRFHWKSSAQLFQFSSEAIDMQYATLSTNDRAIIEACWQEKGWGASRIIKEFPGKRWRRRTVANLIAKIKKNGSSARKPGSGRPFSAVTPTNTETVADEIQSQEENPGSHKSQRHIAKQLNVSRRSVSRMVKNLGLKAFKRIRVSRRTANVREKRKTRCQQLLARFSEARMKKIIFTDEKDFTFEVARNRQNDRVYGRKKKQVASNRLYHESSRFTRKLMVSAGVSWSGKTSIHFIDTEPVKVNSQRYIELLNDGLLPDCRRLYPRGDFVFQQDGAPSHMSNASQAFLRANTGDFIDKTCWPPQSPDCNPLDYYVWNALQEKVYEGRNEPFTLEELKETITVKWQELSMAGIRRALSQWRARLQAVCNENGGHIEHLF
jgi:transposase